MTWREGWKGSAVSKRQKATVFVLLMALAASVVPSRRASAADLTEVQHTYRTLYSAIVGIYAHKVIGEYLSDQYNHIPPYAPNSLSPKTPAVRTMSEGWVKLAKVAFQFPVPEDSGKGGRTDFAAMYNNPDGTCTWEVFEIKPHSWHFKGLGQAALAQLTSYTSGILRELKETNPVKNSPWQGCSAEAGHSWREGQPGWKTIPAAYTPLLDRFNVKMQVQTWYSTEPGIVYYRLVWKDKDSRDTIGSKELSTSLAKMVNLMARKELPVSQSYDLQVLVPWMKEMYNEKREAGGDWEAYDSLQELIDIRISLNDPSTPEDEDEGPDTPGGCDWEGNCTPDKERNMVDPDVTTLGMVQYWQAWSTPDPWYFKDYSRATPFPIFRSLPDCAHPKAEDKPFCAAS